MSAIKIVSAIDHNSQSEKNRHGNYEYVFKHTREHTFKGILEIVIRSDEEISLRFTVIGSCDLHM